MYRNLHTVQGTRGTDLADYLTTVKREREVNQAMLPKENTRYLKNIIDQYTQPCY